VLASASIGLCACAPPGSSSSNPVATSPIANRSDTGPLRVADNGSRFSIALPAVPAGQVDSFRTKMLCSTGVPVTVRSVAPVLPVGGLRVTWWGVRPNPFQAATPTPETGQVVGYFPDAFERHVPSAAVVRGSCPDASGTPTDVLSELAISVTKPGKPTAYTDAFKIEYTYQGGSGVTTMQFGIALCAVGDVHGVCDPA
jgi:hypothetical protein